MIDAANSLGMQTILDQIRQFEARARGTGSAPLMPPSPLEAPAAVGESSAPGRRVEFGGLVREAIESVNGLQNGAQALSNAYERGEDVPLTDVVLAMQKSSIAFEATLQVRNQMMKAYDEIRNMPV